MDFSEMLSKLGNLKSGIDIKKAVTATAAFGKKNAPALAAGGSIVMNWGALILFGKEFCIAQKRIDIRVAELNSEVATGDGVLGTMKAEKDLTWKEKGLEYLECCWPSLVLKIAADVVAGYGAKISMDEIAKAYMIAQLYKEDGDKLKKQILNEKDGEKKLEEYEKAAIREELPPEEILQNTDNIPGEGRTLFVEPKSGRKWWGDLSTMQRRLYDIKENMNEKVIRACKRKFGDAFFASDSPYPDDYDIYVTMDFDDVLEAIGAIGKGDRTELGDVLEIRDYYGDSDFLNFNIVLDPDPTNDPKTGQPVLCYVRFNQWIYGTNELLERNP